MFFYYYMFIIKLPTNRCFFDDILIFNFKLLQTEEDKKYFVLGGNHLVQATRAIWPER